MKPKIAKLSDRQIGFIFLMPAVCFLVLTSLFPLGYAFFLSLCKWNLTISLKRVFIGIDNYIKAFKDPEFINSITRTTIFVVTSVTIEMVLGIIIALLVTRRGRQFKFVRSLLLIPMIISSVVVGILWRMLLNVDSGLINCILESIGLPPQPWLIKPVYALISIIICEIWEWTPFVVLVMSAGIMSLPQYPQEAALVDGASKWQIFWNINLPLLKPIILVIFLLRFMDAFKVFGTVYVITRGGPGSATEVISYHIYQQALKWFRVGYASAISWIFLVFIFLLAIFVIRERQKIESY